MSILGYLSDYAQGVMVLLCITCHVLVITSNTISVSSMPGPLIQQAALAPYTLKTARVQSPFNASNLFIWMRPVFMEGVERGCLLPQCLSSLSFSLFLLSPFSSLLFFLLLSPFSPHPFSPFSLFVPFFPLTHAPKTLFIPTLLAHHEI